MLEQAWADLVSQESLDASDLLSRLLSVGDDELLRGLAAEAKPGSIAERTLHCITGDRRRPYRRLVTWSRAYRDEASRETYRRLYALSREATQTLVQMLAERLSTSSKPLRRGDLILDIPPRDKDRLPEVTVVHGRSDADASYTSLAESSRIVSGMGEDFLAAVKKIRLFVHPDHAARLSDQPELIDCAIQEGLSSL